MYRSLRVLLLAMLTVSCAYVKAQNLPGDSLCFGPMFSAVYNDTVRVWILTKSGTGSGNTLTLQVRQGNTGSPMTGTVYNSDTRLGYNLRSYEYVNLVPGQSYTATIMRNGIATNRTSTIVNGVNQISDFEFLAGGCGRIMDTTRCVDKFEGMSHINGTTDIYKQMASEGSDLMVWLGDAVYLFGIEHSGGTCPGMINDWDTRDAMFSRYFFNRQFHDTLLRAMPQLAITDNHDIGGNEFNKNMATIGIARANFMDWWQNPKYTSNSQGQGLYSSYKHKDVEFFLLDNRSYRDNTTRHLGVGQMAWLRNALLNSTATFKVLVSGTPSFDKRWGGRNFSITAEGDSIVRFIKDNNINGVMCYSADIHAQEFYGRYNDHTYPFFDVLSGNLASDIGSGNTSINPDNDVIFDAVIQTYTRTNIYGQPGDRRYKIEYVSPNGVKYYGAIIHEDMLKSIDDSTRKLALSFTNSLYDSSKYHRALTATGLSYGNDRDNQPGAAAVFNNNTTVSMAHRAELDMHDRTFSITYWQNVNALPASGYAAVFSNSTGNNGYTIGVDAGGHAIFNNHATGQTYTSSVKARNSDWAHITWKYDNVKLQLSFYWNGNMVQRWSNVKSPDSANGPLYLGTNVANRHFNGSLDEFVIYGKLISDKTIQQLSGYKTHRGTAISFAGSQNMYIPATQVNPVFSNAFTFECWARFTGTATGPIVSTHGRINNQTTGWDIEFTNNKPNLVFGNNSTTGWLKVNEAGYPWQTGEWNHIAATAVPNDSIYLFVNGQKVGSAKYTTYFSNTFNFGFAKSSSYGSTAAVEMDEFRIWNTPQPIDSIRKRMHYKLKGNENNLALYYDFNAFTDTSIISQGLNTAAIKLQGGTIISSTAPNTVINDQHRAIVTGNWTIGRNENKGLIPDDAISLYTANLIAGRNNDSTVAPVSANSNIHYLKGGWQLDALNLPVATINVDLSKCLPGYDSISRLASEYYLLKKDTGNTFNQVNTGYFDGRRLKFLNTYIDTGIYHIAWKADTAAALFDRGGALSLLGSHNVQIPATGVNAALSGPFTIELWGRLMQSPAMNDNNSFLSNHGRLGGNSRGITIEFPRNSTLPHVTIGKNASDWNILYANRPWGIGEWNHIAISFIPNDSARLYINGAQVATKAATTFPEGVTTLSLGNSVFYGGECIGMMDELRIWKKAKTAKEIQEGMHLTFTGTDTTLSYNYSFGYSNNGYIYNAARTNDSITITNARVIPSTSPIGNIARPQQHHVTGSWSVRDSMNNGLMVMVSIPDHETNLVIGKDSLSGTSPSPTVQNLAYLRTLWQLDPLKLSTGQFTFDGAAILGNDWPAVKNSAVEYYLLRQDNTGQLVVQIIGTETNDRITFNAINIGAGKYTLGWKNQNTGLVETGKQTIQFFPNPTHDLVTIAGLDAREIRSVYVHDITGKAIPVSTQSSAEKLQLNVSVLQPGTYIVVLVHKNNEKTALKFIKL